MSEYATPGVYIEEIEIGAKPIEGVSTSVVGFVGMTAAGDDYLNKPKLITDWGQFVTTFGRYDEKKAPYLPAAIQGFFSNGGKVCYVVKVKNEAKDGDYIGTDGGTGKRTGLQAFIEIEDINIVCIPGITSATVQQAMKTHCEDMKYRFAILDPMDPDKDKDPIETVRKQKENVVSEKGHAALYFPKVKVPVEIVDKEKNIVQELMLVHPSGYLAGIYARSDAERGVFKAPANEIIRGALEIEYPITDGEQEILNPDGIDCIRAFTGRGIRVWGARTTASNTLWKYVNVRRLFNFIEASLEKGTQWVVFEPNDEKLWARVIQTIRQFLTRLWKDGALMGSTPEQAFFIKCDRTTMTQDDIDNGRLIALVGIAPVKPAEFVIIRIAQWQGGSEVSD